MVLKKDKDLKLFYSIGEVADKFNVNESTLRFWEKEFDILKPRKNAKGTRFYKEEDIQHVGLIHLLVKKRGMTLAGARKKLKEDKDRTVKQYDVVSQLEKIKEELISLRDAFDALDRSV